MLTRGRAGAGSLILIIVATLWFGIGGPAGATVHGTPTPASCARAGSEGSPIASPSSEQATPIAESVESPADYAAFLAALAAEAVHVETEEELQQEFFTAEQITRLVLTGGPLAGPAELQVYEYTDAEARAADAAQITPDGNLTTVMITWIAPPHFFCGERIIVLYLGDDPAAIELFTDLLGPQFAGR